MTGHRKHAENARLWREAQEQDKEERYDAHHRSAAMRIKGTAPLREDAPPIPDTCDFCGRPFVMRKSKGLPLPLAVKDHDRATGAFRGWVHPVCNMSLIGANTLASARLLVAYLGGARRERIPNTLPMTGAERQRLLRYWWKPKKNDAGVTDAQIEAALRTMPLGKLLLEFPVGRNRVLRLKKALNVPDFVA